jgi:hypothetical protein
MIISNRKIEDSVALNSSTTNVKYVIKNTILVLVNSKEHAAFRGQIYLYNSSLLSFCKLLKIL